MFAAPILSFSPLRIRRLAPGGVSPDSSEHSPALAASSKANQCVTVLATSPFYGPIRIHAELADVDGDHHPDCCAVTPAGVLCTLWTGASFGTPERWTVDSNFGLSDKNSWFTTPAYYETIRFADINGDGRADICGRAADGVMCALSTGRSFARSTNWLSTAMTDSDGWLSRDPVAYGSWMSTMMAARICASPIRTAFIVV